MAHDVNTNYSLLIDEAVKKGDYANAAKYEQQRNEKIVATGSSQQQTNLYSQYLGGSGGNSSASTGSAGNNLSASYTEAMDRAVGVGGKATTNLGAYKDASGKTTTYRPELAGQTVQMGNQYVTYNAQGYPVKSTSVEHAKNLGNAYTSQYMGLDQTKVSNAADIYKGIYNATMHSPSYVSGSALNNAYGKQNIQYSGGYSVADYEKMIRDAAGKGNNVYAGYLEDSKNALIADRGLSPGLQTSRYNGGWNYVDNGGGVGNIYRGAQKDAVQTEQALGGGWYAGQGKGDAGEYFYRNYDAPGMQEVLSYARAMGYNVDDENAAVPVGDLARQMMVNGYVSPERLQKAETLKITVPAALKALGIESESDGTQALDMAIRNMQRGMGDISYTSAMQGGGIEENEASYAKALAAAAADRSAAAEAGNYGLSTPYTTAMGGGYGGSYEDQLMSLYNNGNDAMKSQLRAIVDAQTRQAADAYGAEKEDVNQGYADMNRQLYINRENNKKNLAQQLAAYGITGGASESALLDINTGYEEALRQSEQARIGELSALDRAIAEAQLAGELSYAQQALQLEQDRINNQANVLQMMMNRQDSQAATEFDRQMAAADLMASVGDYSGYKTLGLTDEQIAALGSAYTAAQQSTARSSNGGGGNSSSKPRLTAAQTLAALESGAVNDQTLAAYEYYYGEPWKSAYDKLLEKTNVSTGTSFSSLHEAFGTGHPEKAVARIDEIWDTLTDDQKSAVRGIAAQYGYAYQP